MNTCIWQLEHWQSNPAPQFRWQTEPLDRLVGQLRQVLGEFLPSDAAPIRDAQMQVHIDTLVHRRVIHWMLKSKDF